MDKLTAIKIKYNDGTYSDEIPVSVLSENVEWDNTHTLVDVLGSIDVDAKGTIQAQIDKLSNNTQLTDVLGNVDVSAKGTVQDQIDKLSNNNTQFDTQLASINDNLNDFAMKQDVESEITTSLSTAKSYADTQDATTLASAKSYADSLSFQKVITSGTSAPSGGSDGDIYIQY